MIPVVMLGINTGALSSLFLTLFCLTMARASFKHISVIYLMIVVLRSIELVAVGEGKTPNTLFNMMDIVQVAHLAFSLLINISATSIIALKAWCVRVDGVFGKR